MVLCIIIGRGLFFFSLGVFMFGSNVQPRRIVRESRKEPWWCHTCNIENKAFYSKCPKCAEHRPH